MSRAALSELQVCLRSLRPLSEDGSKNSEFWACINTAPTPEQNPALVQAFLEIRQRLERCANEPVGDTADSFVDGQKEDPFDDNLFLELLHDSRTRCICDLYGAFARLANLIERQLLQCRDRDSSRKVSTSTIQTLGREALDTWKWYLLSPWAAFLQKRRNWLVARFNAVVAALSSHGHLQGIASAIAPADLAACPGSRLVQIQSNHIAAHSVETIGGGALFVDRPRSGSLETGGKHAGRQREGGHAEADKALPNDNEDIAHGEFEDGTPYSLYQLSQSPSTQLGVPGVLDLPPKFRSEGLSGDAFEDAEIDPSLLQALEAELFCLAKTSGQSPSAWCTDGVEGVVTKDGLSKDGLSKDGPTKDGLSRERGSPVAASVKRESQKFVDSQSANKFTNSRAAPQNIPEVRRRSSWSKPPRPKSESSDASQLMAALGADAEKMKLLATKQRETLERDQKRLETATVTQDHYLAQTEDAGKAAGSLSWTSTLSFLQELLLLAGAVALFLLTMSVIFATVGVS